jgi:hypothetical protein
VKCPTLTQANAREYSSHINQLERDQQEIFIYFFGTDDSNQIYCEFCEFDGETYKSKRKRFKGQLNQIRQKKE